ncbi:hypothetical protein [Staphylococcus carnosus]|uniref:Uncharacterized protein n=1 Tax=Staphylococcus carnosus TaxID=1281 RepID=A0AAJ0JP36_STACA|nr:hypothetical protein [Staphylococcus carnosus]KKB25370.1 hypothetical protein VV61_07185 [Staphylococcus carnosus]KOR12889.1 hypothetical protein AMC75_06405 [Staphylococcus carnosus]POA03151.1 hypothetical protein CD153_05150 [Staphylococcus carnosus]QQS84540.1 hypothetical protein I6J04_09075 [Staphylococcus carnosus]QRQ04480.1 hypothetical protein I6J34_09470 [Staphylococcus carnosus]
MTQLFQDEIRMTLYDLSDEVKMELSELNQSDENITRGPDHKLFERGILLGYLQGRRQMIHAVEELLNQSVSDKVFKSELDDIESQLESDLSSEEESQNTFNNEVIWSPEKIYQSALALSHTYELQGKRYIVKSIGAKIKEMHLESE